MGTFSAFTCTMPLSVLEPWEQRYYHAVKGHRLGGLGEGASLTPTQPSGSIIECWAAAARNFDVNEARYAHDDIIPYLGTERMIWVGTFLCPKADPWGRHQLYDAYLYYPVNYGSDARKPVNIRTEAPGKLCLFPAGQQYTKVPILKGMGYYDGAPGVFANDGRAGEPWDDAYTIFQAEARPRSLIRGHTPVGVAHKGIGAGAVLYAAMGMGAVHAGFEGVYSIEGTRSNEAAILWRGARDDKTGPLAKRFGAAIEAGNPDARVRVGSSGHCLDENLVTSKSTALKNGMACPVTIVGCSTNDDTLRRGTVGVDYIVPEGVKRWGLMVFDGRTKAVANPLPKWGPSDITKAFGTPKGSKAQARAAAGSLSNIGAELLARASVGASPYLVTKLAQVIHARSPDLSHAFLTREDIVAILSATPAGRKLVTDAGKGGALDGVGSAILRDVEAAMYRPTSPTALTLPPVSRAAQAFVNAYPDEA